MNTAPHQLGKDRYHIELTDSGSGRSSYQGVALNRWSGDTVEAGQGFFVYLRDLDDGALWSSTLQPALIPPQDYQVSASPDGITVRSRTADIEALTTVAVRDDSVELRTLRLRNHSGRTRNIELTSFMEIALGHAGGDLAHPAFSKLFVQTSLLRAQGALLARRRPRAADEHWPLAFHALLGAPLLQWETDRVVFVGRGRSAQDPALAMRNSVGNVLDPVFALRTRLSLAPGAAAEVAFVLGAAAGQKQAAALLKSLGAARLPRPLPPAPRTRSRARGRFVAGGTEYAIRMPWNGQGLDLPPMPWVNVIANSAGGCIVSETGAGYTWARNSQANRLTPWSNDTVSDPHGEALYLRDEDSRESWSPLPGPKPAPCDYEARHGFGYSVFSLDWSGLEQQTTVAVTRHDPLKLVRLRLRNRGTRARRLSLFSYQRLVLGSQPGPPGDIQTWRRGQALCASSRRAGDFAGGIAFSLAVGAPEADIGCDRRTFIGQGRSLRFPAALEAAGLDGALGENLDPCFARRLRLELTPGESVTVYLLLGEAVGESRLQGLLDRYATPASIESALRDARKYWKEFLGAIKVETPMAEIDRLVNGWLPYQALSCRIWGRSAFYQSGGAFGYRDQLQDAGNLCLLEPALTREQILLHARHQFVEGDVLHWWHPQPLERGLRTRFSDDLLWLPYVTRQYLEQTGDDSILDQLEPFIAAPLLADGHDEEYLKPEPSPETATVYEHCCRALDRSLTKGSHGLPLMGTGDWNDGMNRIGREGRGESVWLGFFLVVLLDAFVPLARRRGDESRAGRYAAYREQLVAALNDTGWDGAWFRRAYYDDGTPLGTAAGDECRLDGLVQAWAVLSGAAAPGRAAMGMAAVKQQLVSETDGLIRLLTPPFVDTPQDPGYIKGYVAGIRENGGQYTHAACWMIAAAARLGWREEAARWLGMISPAWHSRSAAARERYKVEPYVLVADIYSVRPHAGRGGWTWYTGAAGWAYRVALESVLGLRPEGGKALLIEPCVPDAWPGYSIDYRVPGRSTRYRIRVGNPERCAERVVQLQLDGADIPLAGGVARVPIADDGQTHEVTVTLGRRFV